MFRASCRLLRCAGKKGVREKGEENCKLQKLKKKKKYLKVIFLILHGHKHGAKSVHLTVTKACTVAFTGVCSKTKKGQLFYFFYLCR